MGWRTTLIFCFLIFRQIWTKNFMMHLNLSRIGIGSWSNFQNTLLRYWFKLHGFNYKNLFATLAIQYCWLCNISKKLANNCLFLSSEWYKLNNNKHLIKLETSGMFDSTYFDNWNQRSFDRQPWKVGMFDSDKVQIIRSTNRVEQNIIWTKSTAQI